MIRILKYILWSIVVSAVVCLTLLLICNQIVESNAKGKTSSDLESLEYNEVGLLLGCPPLIRYDNSTNFFFVYRIDAAAQLYRAGKIKRILISGDDDCFDGVKEVKAMKDSLLSHGVPASAMIYDSKGYRTICSIVNASKVFGLKRFTIISQEFHNERALYQAEHLGLDVEHLQAYNAKDPELKMAFRVYVREYFARMKMFWDLLSSSGK